MAPTHVYVHDGITIYSNRKMVYFKINEAPSTPQLAELIKILLPQKIRTMTDVLAEFKKLKIPKAQYYGSSKKSAT